MIGFMSGWVGCFAGVWCAWLFEGDGDGDDGAVVLVGDDGEGVRGGDERVGVDPCDFDESPEPLVVVGDDADGAEVGDAGCAAFGDEREVGVWRGRGVVVVGGDDPRGGGGGECGESG